MKSRSKDQTKEKHRLVRGTVARAGAQRYCAPTRSGREGLDEVEAGEEIADFEGGGVWGVGTVSTVGADAGAEIATDGAGRGFFRVGGAHGVAPFCDGAFGFEDHGEDFT